MSRYDGLKSPETPESPEKGIPRRAPGGGGQPDKRRAILDGARAVFARDGYSRASIDAISATACVSTRTVYNHFADKRALFQEVAQESARRAAEAQIALIERHLSDVTDLEAALLACCRALASPLGAQSSSHRALVRQVNAEAEHVPPEVLDAWREAGPLRVRRALGRRLQLLAERGLLHIPDPSLAAFHLMTLTAGDPHAVGGGEEGAGGGVARGVRAFLHGYAAK